MQTDGTSQQAPESSPCQQSMVLGSNKQHSLSRLSFFWFTQHACKVLTQQQLDESFAKLVHSKQSLGLGVGVYPQP